MITIFNRRELILTYDLREVNRVREVLLAHRIDFYVKSSYPRTAYSIGAGKTRAASFGSAGNREQFTVYVHKADWDHAMYLLRKIDK